MTLVRYLSRFVRSTVRALLVPALLSATYLGVMSGGHARASLSPSPAKIATELTTHHDLPKGTQVSLGDPKKPTTVTYDEQGRVLVTPPKGQTFGSILWRGFGELGQIAQTSGVDLAHASTLASAAATSQQ